MKEHEINSTNSFIAGWYIPVSVCDFLLQVYNDTSTIKNVGVSGFIESTSRDVKDSIDAIIPPGLPYLKPYWDHLDKCISLYNQKYPWSSGQYGFALKESSNIQHYPIGGGFKQWHCERASAEDIIRDRHLVFMTYLNDVDDGGTEFYHQQLTIKAEKGLTVIWPAEWTHQHKGQISYTKEKTIITGWLSYN